MTDNFEGKSCVACQRGAPPATDDQLKAFLDQHPDWSLVDADSVPKLQRVYTTKNFVQALALTNAIGEMAEAESHHPALTTEWGTLTVQWWTHKIKGIHENDLIAAAKSDRIAEACLGD